MRSRFLSAALLLLILEYPLPVFAQTTNPASPTNPVAHEETCKEQVTNRFNAVIDEYHQVLYGSTGATLTPDNQTVLRLGGTRPPPDRAGIFETKERMTSELISPLLESYRVLRCNMRSVCEQLKGTLETGASPDTMSVEPLGCLERELPRMDLCTYTGNRSIIHEQALNAYCTDVMNKTLPAERSALTLAVAYDANYRSNVQTIGMFDSFLKLLPVYLFRPLQQMVGLLGKIHQVPCFLTQCDMPPSP